jgi:hypothetical protein
MLDVTDLCNRSCSNCTRAVGHGAEPYIISLDDFERACIAVADFATDSVPDRGCPPRNNGFKAVGMIGGEPTMHPQFDELCAIMRKHVPDRRNRCLFAGWRAGADKHRAVIQETFGPGSGWNEHNPPSVHQPLLVAIREIVPDEKEMWRLINGCWVENIWCNGSRSTGFYFCEVASTLDWVLFGGAHGLPLEPGIWRHDIEWFRPQIEALCPYCGAAAPLPPRIDCDDLDDISPGNLAILESRGSPRIKAGRYKVFDCQGYAASKYGKNWVPNLYRSEQRYGPQVAQELSITKSL